MSPSWLLLCFRSAFAWDPDTALGVDAMAEALEPARAIVVYANATDAAAMVAAGAGDLSVAAMVTGEDGFGAATPAVDLIAPTMVVVEDPSLTTDELVAELSFLEGVLYVEPDGVLVAEDVVPTVPLPTDPLFGSQWALHNTGQSGGSVDADIDAPEAWALDDAMGRVVVGIIDSGIDYNHDDLNDFAGSVFQVAAEGRVLGDGIDNDGNGYVDDYRGFDAIANRGSGYDYDNHGTHVAGIIGGLDNDIGVVGVTDHAAMLPCRALSGSVAQVSDVIQCVAYMRVMGAQVVNVSLGGWTYSQALYDAFEAATDEGILFVISAGNDGDDTDVHPHYPSGFDLELIVSVGASTWFDRMAYFSNYGPETVDLLAPGSQIWSTIRNEGFVQYDGTSMAAPFVTGAAALAFAHRGTTGDPVEDALAVKDALLRTVDPLSGYEDVVASGGRLNVANLLRAIDYCEPGRADLDGDTWCDWDDAAPTDASVYPGALLSRCPADVDGDGRVILADAVQVTDLIARAATWSGASTPPSFYRLDMDHDLVADLADAIVLGTGVANNSCQ